MSHDHAAPADPFDNPGASYAHAHHGHIIVPQRILLGVLATLLFFTVATVAAAKGEEWVMHTFDIVLPGWVNVFVALSIATVKTTLVCLFFMQLRWDNPLNALVFIFCLFTMAFFLGFTMIDLGMRSTIYAEKGQYIVPGGSGGLKIGKAPDGSERTIPANMSIATYARDVIGKSGGHGTDAHDAGHDAHAPAPSPMREDPKISGRQRSRPKTGITLPEFKPAGAAPAGHGGGHAPEPTKH